MKQIWPNYSYSPTTNVLTLTGLNIDRDQLLLVSAPERGRIMYNFADSATTASAFTAGANTGLTLVASTAGLTTTASFIIYFDDQTTALTVGNFPATQPVSIASVTIGSLPLIAGTVTANIPAVDIKGGLDLYTFDYQEPWPVQVVSGSFGGLPLSITGTVTVGNTVTIAGTVTANVLGVSNIPLQVAYGDEAFGDGRRLAVSIVNGSGEEYTTPLPISGTVTVGNTVTIAGTVTANPTGTQTISGTVTANAGGDFANSIESVNDVANVSKKIAVQLYDDNGSAVGVSFNPLPISGTVTVAGTVTANVPLDTDAYTALTGVRVIGAGIDGGLRVQGIDPSNFNPTNLEEGGGIPIFSVNNNPLPISGTVTVGNTVTIGSLPLIAGTVTANTFAIQGTAVTTSNFTSTTASTLLAGFNATRQVLTIFSEGPGTLFVCPGATCTTIQYQVRLSSGDYYEVPNHQTSITHSAVFATAGTARVTEVS